MSTVRLRRLSGDYEKLTQYVQRHPRVKLVQAEGEPPEKYQLEYRIRSMRQKDDDIVEAKTHLVEISLPRNYPRTPPQCRMLSPVFHPNIAPHAICVGDHWSPGESLESIVIRIGEILAFQSYNLKSPLNGEAARWVEEHEDELPTDAVSLLPEIRESQPAKAAPAAQRTTIPRDVPASEPAPVRRPATPAQSTRAAATAAPEPKADAAPEHFTCACPECGTKYKLAVQHRGRTVRCKRCEAQFSAE